ncbi:MAG: hypothetical protein H6581_31640 [Bacteroidia bacterium]|nr:hypothetical protein [Bacteroidia bacterium]
MLLHILNGDGLAHVFEQGNLQGDRLIWRELMSEGPAPQTNSPQEFWKIRQQFIDDTFGEGATYDNMVLAELAKLDHLENYQEVCLWFEHDLVCQINLIFVLTQILERVRKPLRVSLVCMNSHPEVPGFKGLGQLSPAQLGAAFLERVTLMSTDLRYAQRVWQAYCNPDPVKLLEIQMEIHPKFPYLPQAISAHFSRFPSTKNGLNAIEEILLKIVVGQGGEMPFRHLVRDFLIQDDIFGCGDLMVEEYAQKLSPGLLEISESAVRLTDRGRRVLSGEEMWGE